jgi:cell division protein FtsI (penicillin-binding protein 3)
LDTKKDILFRVYICFIGSVVVCFLIIGKAFYIQQVQGKYWRSLNDSLHQKTEEIIAERGTIYSEDGKMLSTSIPEFDIYIDFAADALRAKKGKLFYANLDSLSMGLSSLFNEYSEAEYKKILVAQYKDKNRYFLLKRKISFAQYKELKSLPLVKLGRNRSGFIAQVNSKRLNPYNQLAYRTIGLVRNENMVGLELSYDSLLKGKSGVRTVRYLAGGAAKPIDEAVQTETENGKDIVTTIDVLIQEITEKALNNMMVFNNAEHGCAIVMETKTGKIKAIANLGFDVASGKYLENKNYSLYATEPGSTFKLATMISLLDDNKIKPTSTINLQGGVWQFANNATVFDAEQHGRSNVTAQQAFELSSNVGMAKMVWNGYKNNPQQFINKLHSLHIDTTSGIDIVGERKPTIHKPGTKGWGQTTLPWMSFGYNLQVTPLQTLTLYNAVANNGKMMKPYLVSAIRDEGVTIQENNPTIINEKICNDSTLIAVKKCLLGVCFSNIGTAHKLFKNSSYLVAGKTGTSLVADGRNGYNSQVYQSSFAGYFPADNPQFTCIVVIKNKPNALYHFGAEVAGPVFKEIADRLYTTYVKNSITNLVQNTKKDSAVYNFFGYKEDIKLVLKKVNIDFDETQTVIDDWVSVTNNNNEKANFISKKYQFSSMPLLTGMNLKDAIYLCENLGLKVLVAGKGKINNQSITTGNKVFAGQVVKLFLN